MKTSNVLTDPVCGMTVTEGSENHLRHGSQSYYFCSQGCEDKFKASPEAYLHPEPADRSKSPTDTQAYGADNYTCPMHPEIEQQAPGSCPKCGMALELKGIPLVATKTEYIYICPMHPEVIQDHPGSCPKCGMALGVRTIDAENVLSKQNEYLVLRPIIWGLAGAAILFSLYMSILSLSMNASYAWTQFIDLWEWMVPLVVGFGIQLSLFFYMKGFQKIHESDQLAAKTIVATTSVSTGTMVACCLHHATDVLPILGLSAAAIFFAQYQTLFLSIGIVSNIIGLAFMFDLIQKHKLFLDGGVLWHLRKLNSKLILYGLVFVGGGWILYLLINEFL